jgi:hypothetical protein
MCNGPPVDAIHPITMSSNSNPIEFQPCRNNKHQKQQFREHNKILLILDILQFHYFIFSLINRIDYFQRFSINFIFLFQATQSLDIALIFIPKMQFFNFSIHFWFWPFGLAKNRHNVAMSKVFFSIDFLPNTQFCN